MKLWTDLGLAVLLIGLLVSIDQFLGRQVLFFAMGLSSIWFVIAFVLLTRPPGVPEFVSDEVGSDEQHVVRRDVIPKLPIMERIRLSVGVACGSSLVLWLTLALLSN